MPLTKLGLKMQELFIEEYGAKKGKKIFYSYLKKHKERTKSWHRI